MNNLPFSVKEITATNDYGEFVIEPLEPGYGYTIGNAIRRVLYTSIPGAAVTSIKISGVKHKFSTVPGLKENVVDLILNIKELNLRLLDSKETATVKLSASGPKEITSGDLLMSDGVEVVDKNQYLGSLAAGKGKFEMEMTVERGLGYSLAEERRSTGVGMIPTDAIFTPVKRVTYAIESTRVGRQTNLDRLVLKIWTNGVVKPQEALDESARILANVFSSIYQPKEATTEGDAPVNTISVPESLLQLTIDELDLPTRIYNSLRNGGIETVEQLLKTPRRDLISMRNMGGKSVSVIDEKLQEKGINLPA